MTVQLLGTVLSTLIPTAQALGLRIHSFGVGSVRLCVTFFFCPQYTGVVGAEASSRNIAYKYVQMVCVHSGLYMFGMVQQHQGPRKIASTLCIEAGNS